MGHSCAICLIWWGLVGLDGELCMYSVGKGVGVSWMVLVSFSSYYFGVKIGWEINSILYKTPFRQIPVLGADGTRIFRLRVSVFFTLVGCALLSSS